MVVLKKFLLLAIVGVALIGCGGSSSKSTVRALKGTYTAEWVNVADAEDKGSSSWFIDSRGEISGTDTDVSGEFVYTIYGNVDPVGNVNATTSRIDVEEVIGLTGKLQSDSQGRLVGELKWASTPPLTYRYTFTRSAN